MLEIFNTFHRLVNFIRVSVQIIEKFTILELGSGTAAVCASVLLSKVQHFIATDQKHVLKLLRQNIENNVSSFTNSIISKTVVANITK